MAVTRATLDKWTMRGCDNPDCDCVSGPMYFHANCHPKAALEVSYESGSGVLTVACIECHKLVSEIVVAKAMDDTITGP